MLEKQLPFTIREVDLKNKDEEFKKVYASLHPDPEAPAKVPILYDGDTKLIESIVVVEYLASKYRSHGNDILPADEADIARCRLFVELFTNYINSAMFGLYKADSHDAVKAGREKLVYGLRIMDECLRRHGHENGGSYFLGGHFTIADVITTPFLQRVLVTIPGYRNIDVWEIIREEKLERFHRWADAVLARPSSQETKPTDEVILSSLRKFVVEIN